VKLVVCMRLNGLGVTKPGQEAASTTALGGEQRGSQLRTRKPAENEFNHVQTTSFQR